MAAAQLSSSHHAPLRRAAAAAGAYLALYTAWQLGGVGSSSLRVTVGDIAFIPVTLFAGAACLYASTRVPARRQVWAWRLLGLAVFAYGAGDVVQTWYEAGGGQLPYPGADDALYLAFYPLFFAGLISLPIAPRRGARRQMLLDGAIIEIGGGALLWYFALGQAVQASGSGAVFPTIVTAAYPCGDLGLIAALGYLVTTTRSRLPVALLSGGVGLYIVSDTLYAWAQNNDAYSGGSALDFGWIVAICLFALAGFAVKKTDAADEEERSSPDVVVVASYAAVLVVLVLLVITQSSDRFFPDFSLTVTAVVVTLLLGLRQFHARRLLSAANAELHELRAELERLAVTDAHTGLPNYRAASAELERDLERAARYERPLSLLFLDLDHFKQINDARGHEVGDAVLREIAALAPAALRTTDVFGRWGGEEFVAILPETHSAAALVIADRLRRAVAEHRFAGPIGLRVTASIGVATFPDDAATKDDLVAAADGAMYAAKAAGRNRVVYAGTTALDRVGSARTTRLRPPALAS